MRRTTTCVVVLGLVAVARGQANQIPDTIEKVLDLHALIERHGADIGARIWPGFRPDTIPTLYVIAHRGKLLVQWRHAWPTGFSPLAGRKDAAVAGTQMVSLPSGRFISFMSVDSSMTPGLTLGTSIHEAFHSYERSVMGAERRFGGGENAMLVGTYPVFDVENEAAFALEGRRLRRALEAQSDGQAAQLAREFLAIREARQGRLDPEVTEFEKMAEMNEGLAQYALLRGLAEIGRLEGAEWRERARHEAVVESGLLDSLMPLSRRSVRRRFYATGSSIGLLLDRLVDSGWKERLVEENLSLQEMLAIASDYDGMAKMGATWLRRSEEDLAGVRPAAKEAVRRLRSSRQSQADSLLALPGLRIIIDPSRLGAGALQWCGFDPQNTLQTGDGRTMHMRYLKACAGDAVTAEFYQPVVQNRETGTLETVVDPDSLRFQGRSGTIEVPDGASVNVVDLHLESAGLILEAKGATVVRRGREVIIEITKRPE